VIQVYTGCGKGKTTAALGLALRALGAGKKVYLGQFIKGKCYSELSALAKLKGVKIEQFGRGCFIKNAPCKKDLDLADYGLNRVKEIIAGRGFDLVILDEINIALKLKLLRLEDIISLIKNAPRKVELVLTGRYAPKRLINAADLVSEVREIKHYYRKGIKARKGIES
jgi:cob(I)alamin adenosyltransferase